VAAARDASWGAAGAMSIVIYEPYIFHVYGNQRYLLDLFSNLPARRYRLTLVAPYEHPLLDRVRALGGIVEIVRAPRELCEYGGRILRSGVWGRLVTCWAWLRNCLTLIAYLRRRRPALVQCHSLRAILMVGVAARIARVPALWYVKGELANRVLDTLGFLLARAVYFQSPRLRDARYAFLRALLRRKTGILPTGIRLDPIAGTTDDGRQRVRRDLGISSREVNLVCVGHISPLKGIQDILDALLIARDRIPPFRLFVVGDVVLEANEPFARSLKARVAAEGFSRHVDFLGWREDAVLITSVMDILVHASVTEGVPKAVLEALGQGVPVIATDVGGTADVVQRGRTGILVRPGAPAELADALVALCNDGALRRELGMRGRALVHEKYSIGKNVAALEEVYDTWRR